LSDKSTTDGLVDFTQVIHSRFMEVNIKNKTSVINREFVHATVYKTL